MDHETVKKNNTQLYSDNTMPEDDWDDLAGTAEKLPKRPSLFKRLGQRAAEMFRPKTKTMKGNKPAGWPEKDGDFYDFPDDAPTAPLTDPDDARELLKATTQMETKKQTRFEGQRAQELVERELNGKLTTVEHLEEEALSENPEIAKREIEYRPEGDESQEPSKITVYDLKGLPYAFVSHAVDYRRANVKVNGGVGDIGTQTFQDIVENPAVWTETREQAERADGYGTRAANARGDTISCSYSNSETNPNTRVGSRAFDQNLVYGFEAVRPDSVIYMVNRDGGTNNIAGKAETALGRGAEKAIESLENTPTIGYNEILLRRYDESGKPLKPNYIISVDGVITDDMLKHAAFFNVPIVNVETKAYSEKLDRKALEALDAITPDSTYEKISETFAAIKRSPSYGQALRLREGYGRKRDRDGIEGKKMAYPIGNGQLREKFAAFEELEFQKRLGLIEDEFTKFAEAHEEANARGEKIHFQSDRIANFFALLYDVQNDTTVSIFGERRGTDGRTVASNPNTLSVEIIPKNGGTRISTELYDGEHPFQPEKAIASGYLTAEDIEQADSGPYNRLAPLFRRCAAAYSQNIKIKPAA